jgi:hypothetical protein
MYVTRRIRQHSTIVHYGNCLMALTRILQHNVHACIHSRNCTNLCVCTRVRVGLLLLSEKAETTPQS